MNMTKSKFLTRVTKTRIARIARGSHTEGFPKSSHKYQCFTYLKKFPGCNTEPEALMALEWWQVEKWQKLHLAQSYLFSQIRLHLHAFDLREF